MRNTTKPISNAYICTNAHTRTSKQTNVSVCTVTRTHMDAQLRSTRGRCTPKRTGAPKTSTSTPAEMHAYAHKCKHANKHTPTQTQLEPSARAHTQFTQHVNVHRCKGTRKQAHASTVRTTAVTAQMTQIPSKKGTHMLTRPNTQTNTPSNRELHHDEQIPTPKTHVSTLSHSTHTHKYVHTSARIRTCN